MICLGDIECRVTVVGKEVLVDDQHFADAVDECAALAIAIGLNYFGLLPGRVPEAARQHMEAMFE